MNHGFVSVAAATPSLRVADCEYNLQQIMAMRHTAIENHANVLLLPSLCLTGATCGDLFFQYALLEASVAALLALCEDSAQDDLLTFVGLPLPLDSKLYHCVAAVHHGVILGIVPDRHPRDTRYFSPAATSHTTLTIEGLAVPFGTDLLFTCTNVPSLSIGVAFSMEETGALVSKGATLVVYPEAAPTLVSNYVKMRTLWLSQSVMHFTAALHAGAGLGESMQSGIYAGHGLVIENGKLLAEAPRFTTALAISEIDLEQLEHERRRHTHLTVRPVDSTRVSFALTRKETLLTRVIPQWPFVPEFVPDWGAHCEEIFLMSAHALAERVLQAESKCLILGLSGSLDTTLAALTAANAMQLLERPPSDVLAVYMPSYATGARASSNAHSIARELGFTIREIDIRRSVAQHLEAIGHEMQSDIVFNNTQVRERIQILLDLADIEQGFLVGTTDLTDLALGNHTFGGEHIAHFGVNGDIPKTLARAMLQYAADQAGDALRDVLLDVVETPITPLPPQNSDKMPPQNSELARSAFELHDFFLFYTLRWGFPPAKLLRLAKQAFGDRYSKEDLTATLVIFYNRFFANRRKLAGFPNIAHFGLVSLAFGQYEIPVDTGARVWLDSLAAL